MRANKTQLKQKIDKSAEALKEVKAMLVFCRIRLGFLAGIQAVDECIKRMDEANERIKVW
jgi:hypothetical protein